MSTTVVKRKGRDLKDERPSEAKRRKKKGANAGSLITLPAVRQTGIPSWPLPPMRRLPNWMTLGHKVIEDLAEKMSQLDINKIFHQTFTLFPNLPPELRIKIWTLALPVRDMLPVIPDFRLETTNGIPTVDINIHVMFRKRRSSVDAFGKPSPFLRGFQSRRPNDVVVRKYFGFYEPMSKEFSTNFEINLSKTCYESRAVYLEKFPLVAKSYAGVLGFGQGRFYHDHNTMLYFPLLIAGRRLEVLEEGTPTTALQAFFANTTRIAIPYPIFLPYASGRTRALKFIQLFKNLECLTITQDPECLYPFIFHRVTRLDQIILSLDADLKVYKKSVDSSYKIPQISALTKRLGICYG